ncbi:hypothetical protein [Terrabacter sp. 2RAF25]|uniref:hypothetical protein n=1 Tax=Terrabacter sp. 2RAF25 TaxID=3232998 RepID=UPI003F990215
MARTTEENADRVEIALIAGRCGTSSTELKAILGTSEARAEDARSLVSRRAARLGPLHPFAASGSHVSLSSEAPGYRALLALSHLVGDREVAHGNRVLDWLVVRAMRRLLGEPCVVVNFAWPPAVTHSPRPPEFPAAVRWLGEQLGLAVGAGYRPPARQDGGVDIVAAREFAGSVKASPTLLIQTTISRKIREKARDVDLGLWRTWIDLSPAAQTCLAVPFDVVATDLDELHRTGVVTLDRMRLAELLDSPDIWEGREGQSAIRWVDEVLSDRAVEWFS